MAETLEATEELLVYKFYADGVIDAQLPADPSTDPGASGGQIVRYVSHNLSLAKDAFNADEVRRDGQRPMEKHGTRRVPATINGLLSPLTYADFFEAALRGTWSDDVVAVSNTEMTSAAADAAASTFTFAGGNPVTEGFRIGDIMVASGLSATANNGVRFLVIGFSTANNRVMKVYPAPTTMVADTAFTMTTVGRSVFAPATSMVKRKLAVEVYNGDGDISRLYTEGRIAGFDLAMAPNANATINFAGYWRDRIVASGGSAPYFTAPSAETTTEIISSMDGLLMLDGEVLGITTGVSISFQRAPTAPAQIHRQGLTANINLANAVVTGDFTAFLTDTTFMDAFDDETEFELLVWLPESLADDAEAVTFYLPRIKLNANTESIIDGSKALQCGYAAARYFGTRPGAESTSLRITDTLVNT